MKDPSVAQLEALEAEAYAAAAGGDPRAVSLLAQVHSWLRMADAAGGDRDVTALFGIFADEGRARLAEWWAHPGEDGDHA